MSTTSRTLLESTFSTATFAFSSSLLHIVRRISLGGSPSIGGFSSLLAFVYSASKYVGGASAPRVAPPESPVGSRGVSRRHRRSPLRASGKVARGREELGPGHRMDADDRSSDDDDESASGTDSER